MASRMSLALNKPRLDNLAAEIWKSADRLRGKFKAYEYQNVILPMIVIRRLECWLMAWRARMPRQNAALWSWRARRIAARWSGAASMADLVGKATTARSVRGGTVLVK